MIHTNLFESPVNWRITKRGFRSPRSFIWHDSAEAVSKATETTIFLPQDKHVDVIKIRDWLHTPENNVGGYTMTGCYESQASVAVLKGVKFTFNDHMDAAFFRLSWNETRTENSCMFMQPEH